MNVPEPNDIVVSLAGHDAGRLYMVAAVRENRLLLCDGRLRKLDAPKEKSPRHVRIVSRGGIPAGASDKMIRETIALTAAQAAAKEVRLLGKR